MAGKILNPKVNASGLGDVLLLGVSKSVIERVAAPIIGNGTITSGAIKLVAGGMIQRGNGKAMKIAGSGAIIDGVEDIISSTMGGMLGGAGGGSNEEW